MRGLPQLSRDRPIRNTGDRFAEVALVFDVIVVGGGPAGLSAALMLGRCRRRVLLCDDGKPRNAHSRALHGYLSRDGISPAELNALGRAELRKYGVEVRDQGVSAATKQRE